MLLGTLSDINNLYFYQSFIGSNITLKCCPPIGEPIPTISWDLHNEFSNVVHYLQNNSLLIIDSLQAFGEFSCTATNSAGKSKSKLIHVLAGFTVPKDEISVYTPHMTACTKQGRDIKIKCIVSGPADTAVRWRNDKIGVDLGTDRSVGNSELTT